MQRILLVITVVILYAVPAYLAMHVSPEKGWKDSSPAYTPVKSPQENPFYSEGFVNRHYEGHMSHVSTLAPLSGGRMIAAWYSGSREGAKDVAIFISLFDSAEQQWSQQRVLFDREDCREELGYYVKKLGNPVLHSQGDKLWMFFSSVAVGGWSGSTLNYKVSLDEGKSWSPARKIYLSPFFNLTNNVKNKPLPLDDGSFVLPVYHEFITKFSQAVRVRPTGGSGAVFEVRRMTRSGSAIQPSLLPAAESNSIRAFYRNMADSETKHILTSSSLDAGITWGPLKETALPNPNSGFDTVNTSSGDILAVINDSYEDRSNLTLFVSENGTGPWEKLYIFENTPDKEYSYPSLAQGTDGIYHLTYTYERKRIKHIMFNEIWITQLRGNARTD